MRKVVSLGAFVALAAAVHAQVTYVSAERSVLAIARGPTLPPVTQLVATAGVGTFNETAAASVPLAAQATAVQHSVFSPLAMTWALSGQAETLAAVAQADAENVLDAVFRVDAPTPFLLLVSMTPGPLGVNNQGQFEFTGPGVNFAGTFANGPFLLNESGVLAPGEYHLRCRLAMGTLNLANPFASASAVGVLQVASPGTLVLLVIGGLVAMRRGR